MSLRKQFINSRSALKQDFLLMLLSKYFTGRVEIGEKKNWKTNVVEFVKLLFSFPL